MQEKDKCCIVQTYMHADIFYGVALLLLAGFLQGTFAVFFRFARSMRFSVYWLLYATVGLFLCPLIVVFITIPHALEAILSLSIADLFVTCLFGVAWGISGMLLGKALEKIGIAGTYTITLGISVISSVLPILFSSTLPGVSRIILIIGMLLGLTGVVFSAFGRYENHFFAKKGIIYAALSGLLTPAFSLGVTTGKPIAIAAIKLGASNFNAIFLLWFILLFSGFVVTLFYTIYEMSADTRGIWRPVTPGPVMATILAGIFWFGAFALYSYAPAKLGKFGQKYGWALFIAISLIVAVTWGAIYHEWGKKGSRFQIGGTIAILIGMIVIGLGLVR